MVSRIGRPSTIVLTQSSVSWIWVVSLVTLKHDCCSLQGWVVTQLHIGSSSRSSTVGCIYCINVVQEYTYIREHRPLHSTLLVSGCHCPVLLHVAPIGPTSSYSSPDGQLNVTCVLGGTLRDKRSSIITFLPTDGTPQLTVYYIQVIIIHAMYLPTFISYHKADWWH